MHTGFISMDSGLIKRYRYIYTLSSPYAAVFGGEIGKEVYRKI